MKTRIVLILSLTILLLTSSCQNKKEREAKKIVTEWIGKVIKIPKDIQFSVFGKDTICTALIQKPFKVLLYVDSIGCLSCRLQLSDWKILMEEVDSIAPGKVGFIFIFQPEIEEELQILLRQNKMNYPVIIDLTNEINKRNHFPNKQTYQCFLLDKNNKVMMVGNPVHNPQIWNLFKNRILVKSDREDALLTSILVDSTGLNLGKIHFNKKSIIRFKLTNKGEKPLIIYSAKASCGCTNVDFEKEPIKSGKSTSITVSITPDNKGYFRKTIDIYANTNNSPTTLYVKGFAE
ncbi:MAG: DUF1573 domain-containing protein [Bacteroidales bacterium]|nr:DUF1573 domain-containing protein [Bacteroidales bacterium]